MSDPLHRIVEKESPTVSRGAGVFKSFAFAVAVFLGLAGVVAVAIPSSSPPTVNVNVNEGAGAPAAPITTQGTNVSALSVGIIAPVTGLTGTINDWAPTGFSTAMFVPFTTSGTVTLNGIAAGTTGRLICLINLGTNPVLVINEAAGDSTAANRILTINGATWTLAASASEPMCLLYDATTAPATPRWRQWSGALPPAGTIATTPNILEGDNAGNAVASSMLDNGSSITTTEPISTGGATITGATSVQRFIENVVSPASLGGAGSINDYTCSPTDCSTATIINLTSTGIISFDGLNITNTPGRIITLRNTGGQAINIINGAAGSSPANRFATVGGTTWALAAGQLASATFYYDGGASLWTQIATETLSGLTVTNAATISGASTLTGAVTHSNTDTWSGATSHIKSTSTSPSLSAGCGTGATITGGDISGTVVENSTSFSAPCTLTFASTFTTAPTCVVTPRGIQAAFSYVSAATTLAVTNTSAETFDYVCIGH